MLCLKPKQYGISSYFFCLHCCHSAGNQTLTKVFNGNKYIFVVVVTIKQNTQYFCFVIFNVISYYL